MSRWNIEPGNTRLGWIGTGVMGRWMAGHLLQAGFRLTIYNRTQSKAETLLQAGAQWASNPRQVA
ncbi:MAG TPA: NAD(P)-binding domain-containing protein, partial [Thermoguttaceae bacterium]|nr:NAD(P)-binding domain-containing protein [Thermoguttaceae bacterium]